MELPLHMSLKTRFGLAFAALTLFTAAALTLALYLNIRSNLRKDLESSDSFVTLFHTHLDTTSRKMTFVDCGHGFVFLRRADGTVKELFPRGLPLGVTAEGVFEEGEYVLENGDALILYSDGLVDALPQIALDYSFLARTLDGALSAGDMVDRLIGLVSSGKPLPDDLTVLVVRCNA